MLGSSKRGRHFLNCAASLASTVVIPARLPQTDGSDNGEHHNKSEYYDEIGANGAQD